MNFTHISFSGGRDAKVFSAYHRDSYNDILVIALSKMKL